MGKSIFGYRYLNEDFKDSMERQLVEYNRNTWKLWDVELDVLGGDWYLTAHPYLYKRHPVWIHFVVNIGAYTYMSDRDSSAILYYDKTPLIEFILEKDSVTDDVNTDQLGCSLYQSVYVDIKRMEPELWTLVNDDIPFKHPCLRVRGV